jgi:hypothetical protein
MLLMARDQKVRAGRIGTFEEDIVVGEFISLAAAFNKVAGFRRPQSTKTPAKDG